MKTFGNRSSAQLALFVLGALALSAFTTSCRDAAHAAGTSVVITEQHRSLVFTQLRVAVRPPSGGVKGPVLAPETAGAPLESGQSLRLLLPDDLADTEVLVEIEALLDSKVVVRTTQRVTIKLGEQVDVLVTLGMDMTDGGPNTDGGTCSSCDSKLSDSCVDGKCSCGGNDACVAGQACVDGACVCNDTSCSGCCAGNVCKTGNSPDVCGSGGKDCEVCPNGQTCTGGVCSGCNAQTCPTGCCSGSTCNQNAFSECGSSGNACMACDQRSADKCTNGKCLCGDKAQCAAGQRCVSGQCICDPVSCQSGCCDGNTCKQPSPDSCGINGAACKGCDKTSTNACSANGVCRCGDNNPCGAGQKCVAGACVCDSTTCAGCCEGNTCRTRGFDTCGVNGQTCAKCDADVANSCSGQGACQCGQGSPCVPGQRCLSGQCVCDAKSCPTGCCAGNVCLPGKAADACGTAGAACQPCPAGATCENGACSSCNANNCSNGCCRGDTCVVPPKLDSCGVNGKACSACDDQRANICGADGNCRCGSLPSSCAPGQHCTGTGCVCDVTSCAGCCQGNTCMPGNVTSVCGSNGGSCGTCDAGADNCVGGDCRCGTGAACGPGQRCVNKTCVCDSTSCPTGCCDGAVCNSPVTTDNCGANGGACKTCSSNSANSCTNGACMCGNKNACGEGQQCVNGNCVCNAASCPNGCCSGNTCMAGDRNMVCGKGGVACVNCRQSNKTCDRMTQTCK